MPDSRALWNAGHAVGWTAFMCSIALGVVGVTGSESAFQFLARIWVSGMVRGMGIKVETFGAERLDPQRPYVFMANHLSHMDILALFQGIPRQIGFLAKHELRRVPLLGSAMVLGGHVFIDRGQHERAVQALESAAADVRGGKSLVIFPEGTRGAEERIQPFKRGGFHLAMQAGVPVVPVGLRGTRELMAREDLLPKAGIVQVHVGEPLWPGDFADAATFSDATRTAISKLAGMPLV